MEEIQDNIAADWESDYKRRPLGGVEPVIYD